jgi:Ca2+-binding RTX toxin-like protein
MGLRGENPVLRFTTPGSPLYPSMAPDSSRVLYTAILSPVGDTDRGIFSQHADGSGLTTLFDVPGAYDSAPAWSPDGTKIAFEGGLEDSYIDVASADGSHRVRLTHTGDDGDPSWSPDGARIAFTNWSGDSEDLVTIKADGSDPRVVQGTDANEREPAWSRDGKQLVFSSTADDTSQIYVANASGGRPHRLTGIPRAFTSTHQRCTVVGTAGRDVLVGTGRPEVICGLGGNDVLRGRGGNDTLDGGPGSDFLEGGRGTDFLLGGPGDDRLLARDGVREDIDGGAGRDSARIDANDWISLIERVL